MLSCSRGGKTEGAERTGCWTPSVNNVHQPQLCGQYCVTNCLKDFFYQKRTETSRHKKISERNLAHIYRDGSMHECTGCQSIKTIKKCHAHSDISLVPSVHGRRKEHLVSAVCACVKLTIFIAQLFCIMTQPYLLLFH